MCAAVVSESEKARREEDGVSSARRQQQWQSRARTAVRAAGLPSSADALGKG